MNNNRILDICLEPSYIARFAQLLPETLFSGFPIITSMGTHAQANAL